MASYTSSSNGVPSSSYNYTPFVPSNLRQDHSPVEEDDPIGDCMNFLQRHWQQVLRFWNAKGKRATITMLLQTAHQLGRNLTPSRLFSIPHVLVILWVLVLMWGERWIFHTKVESCHWSNWEKWPSGTTPHHLILVADPQLIDHHSYPGRPWPLSSLTFTITDNYMRRSYKQLQEQLHPDTVFFLGDLFDGGREWSTLHGSSEDPSWNRRPKNEVGYAKKWKRKYGDDYWLKEYARFSELFIDPWVQDGSDSGPRQGTRKIITSLPGNHDLGYGSEVKVPVRERFEAYFGDVNRVDVIANHTFVSVDTLSLSARSSEDRAQADLSAIYKPAEEFLDSVQLTKRKAVEKELRRLRGETQEPSQAHKVEEALSADVSNIPTLKLEGKVELPTILLTHVPLYRPPGTQCGPLREHWPPADPTDPLARDDRNAISVSKGYQYQNVLNEGDSIDLVSKIGNLAHAFSGDDHDYCELTHDENQASVKEITVKSISMAMGVPTPGFVMVSMYNPIDAEGKPLAGEGNTLQTHLCLLPNQLGTYARYGGFAFVCAVALAIRALLVPILKLQPFALDPNRSEDKLNAILPTFKPKAKAKAKAEDNDDKRPPSGSGYGYSASSYHSSSPHRSGTRDRSASFTPGVRANGLASQARNASPKRPGGNTKGLGRHSSNREKNHDRWGWAHGPKIEIDLGDDEYYYDAGKSRWKAVASRRGRGAGGRSTLLVVWREMWTTAWRVLWMVLCFWAWLNHKG
ncbi:Cell division control protein 1 [Cytospora mali]|uniref:Cell division control protein 1 n=1 Tax=Cytospora mali TaxID=578113 RepID=A0A194USQ6_CYTMA|nr:Cell division control protein 1 [Valsa mali var. pyri (nom. inval.)]